MAQNKGSTILSSANTQMEGWLAPTFPPLPLQPLQQSTIVPSASSISSSCSHDPLSQPSTPQPIEQDCTNSSKITSTTVEASMSSSIDVTHRPLNTSPSTAVTADQHFMQQDNPHMQKQLLLSPQQCGILMSIDSSGRSKYNDLCFPFDTNPNVDITFRIQSSHQTVVEFHGKPDAVEAAFKYFETNLKMLNCQVDLQVDRLKWVALNEKKPQLLQTIRDKYGISLLYTNGHLTVQEDNLQAGWGNMAAQQAIAEVEEQLSKCNTCLLKPSLSQPLLTSLKFKLSKDSPNSIVFEHEELQYLCSELNAENTKILEMVKDKTIVKFVNASAKIIKTVKNDHKLYGKAFSRVEVFFQERRIAIKGFILDDVFAAKKILLDIVGQIKVTKRMLSCSRPIKAYIHHILFERKMSAKHMTLLSSLSMKVFTENNTVYLEGSLGAIESEEKKLISELVPETFACEECEFSCNRKFIPQIEKSFLSPLHKNYDFTHLISCPSSEAADKDKKPHHKACHDKSRPSSVHGDHKKKRNQSESEDIGFTIMLFSTAGAQQFEKVISSIKELNPQTVRFQVPRGSIEYLQKKKSSLESKYHIWIFFSMPKGDSATVTLHGLRDCDVIECREDMEQSVFITKRYYLDPHALLYLRTKCQNSIEELKNKCKTVSLPPVETDNHANNTATHKNPYILIKGKEADIDHVVTQLDSLVGPEHFKVEMMSFKCLQCLAFHWKRWIERITSEDAIVQVTECKESNDEDLQWRSGGISKADKTTLINIEVIGSTSDVNTISKNIKEREDSSSIQTDIEIPFQKRIQVQDLVKDAGIRNLKVWLSIRGNKVLMLAPSFAQGDLEKASSFIEAYFEESSEKTETISCQSKLALDIMLADEIQYLSQINEVVKRNQVRIQYDSAECTITLIGTYFGLDKLKPLVHKAVFDAENNIDSKKIPMTSIQSPYFEANSFKEFCREMREKYQVEISMAIHNDDEGNNTVLMKAKADPLTVVIVKGDILAEDVDVIVNTVNEDLEHIGGLAKTISDKAGPEVQEECSEYVKRRGKIPTGNVVCLGPGNLPFKNIIHAVVPQMGVVDSNFNQVLYNVIEKSLLASNKARHYSIAIPALCGTENVNVFAEQAIKAVSTFTSRYISLKEVRIVLDSDRACKCISNEIKQCRWLNNLDTECTTINKPRLVDEGIRSQSRPTHSQNPSRWRQINIGYSDEELSEEEEDVITYDDDDSDSDDEDEEERQESVEWYYKGDSSQWEPYLPSLSSRLETCLQSSDLQPKELIQIGKFHYKFNLAHMTQTNIITKKVREMKRFVKAKCSIADADSSDDDSSEGQAKWYFQDDSMEFQPYKSSDSTQLEEWFQLSPSTPTGQLQTIRISGNVYSFNFFSMEQKNIKTGKTRKIKREGLDDVQIKHESKTLKIQGNIKHIDHVMMQVKSKLDNCLSTKSLTLPESVKVARVQRIARKYPIELNVVSKTEIKINGVEHVLQKCSDDIKSEIITSLQETSRQIVKVPNEWQQPQERTLEVYVVKKNSQEWNKVSTKFKESLSLTTILKIERIQNKWLWEKYTTRKQMLHKKNKGNVNEKLLFHGTGSNDPTQVYNSEEGFDMRFCNKGMWGLANYFADSSNYSNSYAYQDSLTGNKQIFLAYVLTGDTHECSSNSKLKMPPEKLKPTYVDLDVVDLKQLRYDTVSGYTNGTKVFMTYDNLKAYPAYLITYRLS